MIKSKGWNWSIVKDEVWKIPSIESFYLERKWKDSNKINLLDLGCGIGRHSILFGKSGFKVSCFDISEYGIEETKKWATKEQLEFNYKVGDMLNLPYKDETFDSIMCYNVISHSDTEGVKKTINEIKRVLKPKGECYLTLCSKETWSFKQDWPLIDENTKIKMQEGEEYKVPHFYADYKLIKELFSKFNILSIRHIETFNGNNGKTTSSYHYHILIEKK